MASNFEKIKEFHRVFECHGIDPETPDPRTVEIRKLRAKLIVEEMFELLEELGISLYASFNFEDFWLDNQNVKYDINFVDDKVKLDKVAKEISDLLYVTYGTASALGIDADRAFGDVHTSNMSKLDENGNVIRREDGKVLKGSRFKEADLSWVLHG